MTTIVRHTRYGDTIFISNPVKAAGAIITWAEAQGHSRYELESLEQGCIRVHIPGLTEITLAPEGVALI